MPTPVTYPGQFVIDNIRYDYSPSNTLFADAQGAVQSKSSPVSNLERVITTVNPTARDVWFTNEDLYDNPSKAFTMIVRFDWDSENYIPVQMRDHLDMLYRSQRGCWIQFDDEFSFTDTILDRVGPTNKWFSIPMPPVAYQRESAGVFDDVRYFCELEIDGDPVDWEDNPWRFDYENGLVRFQNTIAATSIVSASYVCRMFGRIVEFQSMAIPANYDAYNATVLFEVDRCPYPLVYAYDEFAVDEQIKHGYEVSRYGYDVQSTSLTLIPDEDLETNLTDTYTTMCMDCKRTTYGLEELVASGITRTSTQYDGTFTLSDFSRIPENDEIVGVTVRTLKGVVAEYGTTGDGMDVRVTTSFTHQDPTPGVARNKTGCENRRVNFADVAINTEDSHPVFGSNSKLWTQSFGTLTTSEVKEGIVFAVRLALASTASSFRKPKYLLGMEVTGTKYRTLAVGSQSSTAISQTGNTASQAGLSTPYKLVVVSSTHVSYPDGQAYVSGIVDMMATYSLQYQDTIWPIEDAGLDSITMEYVATAVSNFGPATGTSGYTYSFSTPSPFSTVPGSWGATTTTRVQIASNSKVLDGLGGYHGDTFPIYAQTDIVPTGTTSYSYDRIAQAKGSFEVYAQLLSELHDFEIDIWHKPKCATRKMLLTSFNVTAGTGTHGMEDPVYGDNGLGGIIREISPVWRFIGSTDNCVVDVGDPDTSPIGSGWIIGFKVLADVMCDEPQDIDVSIYRGAGGAPTGTTKTISVNEQWKSFVLGDSTDLWGYDAGLTMSSFPAMKVRFSDIDFGGLKHEFWLRNVRLQIFFVTPCSQ